MHRLLESHRRLAVSLLGLCLVGGVGYLCHASHLRYQKQDPRRYYGELKLVPPITHNGFSYYLDGGSISTTLTDTNGVNLTLSFSQPGEFQGDTHTFIGNRNQMWVALGVSDKTDIQPATKIERGSSVANQVATYMELAMETMGRQFKDATPNSEWDRWHYIEFARHNVVYGERIKYILTSAVPVTDRWGHGEPHAPMPDCCD